MAEATNEPPLQVMRQVRGDLGGIRKDISGIRGEMPDIRSGVKGIDQTVDALPITFAMLAGHAHHTEGRVEALETART